MTRTIDLTPSWPQAARIIAAALENGTGAGREAARAELFRMAEILDQLHTQPAPALFEVITTKPGRAAFGQTFTDKADATAYADAMRAAGYTVDPFPAFEPVTLAEALSIAAETYGDASLKQAAP